MTGRAFALAPLVVAVVLLLGGCVGVQQSDLSPGPAQVDVATPELAALRSEAGIDPCPQGGGEPVEGGLPRVTLPCLGGGREVDLSTLRGPMVVNLWASWCGPCREEMPILQEFASRHAGQVAVLGIDFEDVQPRAALELARDTGVTYPLLADPQAELHGADPFPAMRGLPFLALVDEDGVVVHQEFTVLDSRRELERLVSQHLGAIA